MSHDIKDHVAGYISRNSGYFRGKVIVDLPAGHGVSSRMLHEAGGEVHPYDLFPEQFEVDGLACKKADMAASLPIADGFADFVLCQEGIEHVPNQYWSLCEINRILKPGGRLLLTTPNYSNMRSRASYYFSESELYNLMPPNEIDSIWFSNMSQGGDDLYFGHVFSLGIQRLRLLARLAGLDIHEIHSTSINITSLMLLIVSYPLVWVVNYRAYRRAMRKRKDIDLAVRKEIFGDVFRLGITPGILLYGHLMVEFSKFSEPGPARKSVKEFHKVMQV
jgi:SAM-dependent methyltransferase